MTPEQLTRLDQIREQMYALDQEARAIVDATPEEIARCVEMYADNESYDLAETIMDSWGMWEDIIGDRQCEQEDKDNA